MSHATDRDAASVDAELERRRQRRRLRRMEKARLAAALNSLSLDVDELRAEIQRLALQRAMLVSRPRALAATLVSPDGSGFLKVERLFRVFNYGFLQGADVVRSYVEMLTGGRHEIFDFYTSHKSRFAATRCEIRKIHVVPTVDDVDDDDDVFGSTDRELTPVCVAHMSGISHGAFTIGNLQAIWPAVLHNPGLTQALLEQKIAKPMKFTFTFNRFGRVIAFTVEQDYLTTLANGLGGDRARAQRIMDGDATEPEPAMPALCDADDQSWTTIKELSAGPDERHSLDFILSAPSPTRCEELSDEARIMWSCNE